MIDNKQPLPGNDQFWRYFMGLGEELLKADSTNAQINLVIRAIETHVPSKVKISLLDPAYPLPGESKKGVLTLPREKVHSLIEQRYSKLKNIRPNRFPGHLELPILSENHLLALASITFTNASGLSSLDLDFIEGVLTHSALAMQVHRQEVIKIWRSEQLGLVRKVNSQITSFTDLGDLCTQIARAIKNTYKYFNVDIYTYEAGSQTLLLNGSSQSGHSQDVVKVGLGIIGNVAQTKKEIYAPDVTREPLFRKNISLPETRSEVAIPILIEKELLGVLNIESNELDAFHGLDLYVLHALADNIAVAIMNSRLYSDLDRRANQLKTVLEIGHILNTILDPDQLLDQIVHLIKDRFNFPFVHLYLTHNHGKQIKYQIGAGSRSTLLDNDPPVYSIKDKLGIIPWVARNKKSKLVNDVSAEPLYRKGDYAPVASSSELTCPILYGNSLIGVLDIQSDHKNEFDESDLTLTEMLAGSIAITIRNANLFRAEQWRRKVADSFRDVAGLMTSNPPTEKLLELILISLENTLPCDASAIWLNKNYGSQNPEQNSNLYLAAARGVDIEKLTAIEATELQKRQWLQSALSATEPVIRKPNDPPGPLGAANGYPLTYSSVAMPLRAGEKVLGVITLAHRRQGQYGNEAKAIVTTFANYASLSLQNANNIANAEVQAWTSTVLLQVAESTRELASIEDIFDSMTRLLPLLIGVKECGFFIWDESYNAFTLKSSHNIETSGEVIIHENDSPAFSRLLKEKVPVFITDPDIEMNCPELCNVQNLGTMILLPFISHNEVLGAMLVNLEKIDKIGYEKSFDEQTLSILRSVAHQLSTAIENIRLTEMQQEEAYVTAVLLQVAQAVVGVNELDEILSRIIHLMPVLVGIDACVLYLSNEEQQKLTPSQAYAGSRQKEKELLSREFTFGDFELLDWVRSNQKNRTCYLQNDQLDPLNWQKIRCQDVIPENMQLSPNVLMGFPISYRGESFGVLLARELDIKTRFHEKRIEIIAGIAQQIALAIQNDRLQKEKVIREKLQQEVRLARQIQETFLPEHLPETPGWDIDVRWQTAREVGGDFYDIFSLGRNTIGIVIADVSDKGMPAALYMTVTRTLIRAFAQRFSSPARVFRQVNDQLYRDTPNSLFVTGIYAVLDLDSGELTYCNAGHNLPILLRAGRSDLSFLEKGSIALGIVTDNKLEDHVLKLESGDYLLFYTDGVTDTFSPSDEQFGDERLYAALQAGGFHSSHEVIGHVLKQLQDFRNEAPISDDLTIVTVKRN